MSRSSDQLRRDAERIWRAGVDAVRPERLFADQIQIAEETLFVGDLELPLDAFDRIAVVGGGKAGAGMVAGLEAALGERRLAEKQVAGLVSVPADCVTPSRAVRIVAGRPPGVNEPRAEGAAAAGEMLRLVATLGPRDLCLCLLSGGASALLPAPPAGLSVDEKAAIVRLLSASGATINQLNTVRASLSDFKGGRLARACRAGALVTLILSDVLGDPIDLIGSGPTAPTSPPPADALRVFDDLHLVSRPELAKAEAMLKQRAAGAATAPERSSDVHNVILANNAAAVDAAGVEAERLGYNHAMDCATTSEGSAEAVGEQLGQMAQRMRDQPGPNCLITGGEPTVTLAPEAIRGRGGRNQQLVLAALRGLGECRGVALLSGGTDGEDGPTDAAGAVINQDIARGAAADGLDIADALRRNDAYTFFDACGGLLRTGPTHTNVCDVRVVTVDQAG